MSPLLHHQSFNSLHIVRPLQPSIQDPEPLVCERRVRTSGNAVLVPHDRLVDSSCLLQGTSLDIDSKRLAFGEWHWCGKRNYLRWTARARSIDRTKPPSRSRWTAFPFGTIAL